MLDPQRSNEAGTQIILAPTSDGFGPFTGPLTGATIPWTGTTPMIVTLPAGGTDAVGTQLILTPSDGSALADVPRTVPFTRMTGIWTGTVSSTVDLLPAGSDTIGTRIILRPTGSGDEDYFAPSPGLFIEITATYTGTAATTLTIPPAGTGDVGTRLILNPATTPASATAGNNDGPLDAVIRPFTTITLPVSGSDTTTLTLTPSDTGAVGTKIVFAPLLPTSPARSPFTGPFTTISAPGTGSPVRTVTLPPTGGDLTGTQIIFFEFDTLNPTQEPFTGPFTAITGPGTGTTTATVDIPPDGTDGTGTRIILTPTTQPRPQPRPQNRLFVAVTTTTTIFGTVVTTVTIPPAETDGTATLIVFDTITITTSADGVPPLVPPSTGSVVSTAAPGPSDPVNPAEVVGLSSSTTRTVTVPGVLPPGSSGDPRLTGTSAIPTPDPDLLLGTSTSSRLISLTTITVTVTSGDPNQASIIVPTGSSSLSTAQSATPQSQPNGYLLCIKLRGLPSIFAHDLKWQWRRLHSHLFNFAGNHSRFKHTSHPNDSSGNERGRFHDIFNLYRNR
ncbi:60s ribosomal protein l19 [Colletotrichum sojae]|uniref:60s ribosomal protein l19 n=1 Tax=Colletotrichum sojae TaxID=2175907 RepID=A0A8H6IPY1_9PEZI|nr:60s ribosomal protein l19 [Colletotrichum sojae]